MAPDPLVDLDVPIHPHVLTSARSLLAGLPAGGPRPRAVPLDRGRLKLGWDTGRRNLEVEIERDGRLRWLRWTPEAGIDRGELVPGDVGGVRVLVDWVARP